MKRLLTIMMLVLAWIGAARAEEVQVGEPISDNFYELPTNTLYKYSLSQQLYTADEIGMKGDICSLSFYNENQGRELVMDIYLVHTDKTSFSGPSDWITVTDADKVFSGTVTFNAHGWTTIDLSKPFSYNGTSSLALIIDDNTGYKSSPALKCQVFEATGQALRFHTDVNDRNPNPMNPKANSGEVTDYKNVVKFDIEPPSSYVSLPYTTSFEDEESRAGWSMKDCVSRTGFSTSSTTIIHSGEIVFAFYYTQNPPQYLISPKLKGTEKGVEVEFYYRAHQTDYPESFQVGYSTTTNDVSSFTWYNEITTSSTTYELYDEVFPAGVKYVAIKHTSNDKYYFFIDDFSFAVPGVSVPHDIVATNLTYHSAIIDWTAGDASHDRWELSYYTDGGTPDNGTKVEVTAHPYMLQDLTQETAYSVAVRTVSDGEYSNWSKTVTFTTPERFPRPTDLTVASIKPMTAEVSWTTDEHAISNTLRFRNCIEEDVEGGMPEGWTALDADEDGHGWSVVEYNNNVAHSGACTFTSFSYDNDTFIPLTPDNWLIMPKMELGGTLSFYAKGVDAKYAAEHFAIYVSTTNTKAESFVQVSEEYVTTGEWTRYSADLSAYAGQNGYIAIRHFNVTDMFCLAIDDVSYSYGDWTTLTDVTSPAIISGLMPERGYIVEVQSVYDSETSKWASISFATKKLEPTDITATNTTATSADIGWTVNGTETKWNLRYRPKTTAWETMEKGEMPAGWTTVDADGDGNNWEVIPSEDEGYAWGHNSVKCLSSASYDKGNEMALTPDNWLISPSRPLEGRFTFYAEGIDVSYSQEHFAVYVSTTDRNTESFAQVSEEYVATSVWKKYTIDLSSYGGQVGYVAIRHFNVTDMFLLLIDDMVFESTSETPWIYKNGVTAQPVALTGLNENTIYEVQVQAVNSDNSTSEWGEGEFATAERFANGIATGVEDIQTKAQATDGFYNLQGVKLNGKPSRKGIYIQNGKKIVVN